MRLFGVLAFILVVLPAFALWQGQTLAECLGFSAPQKRYVLQVDSTIIVNIRATPMVKKACADLPACPPVSLPACAQAQPATSAPNLNECTVAKTVVTHIENGDTTLCSKQVTITLPLTENLACGTALETPTDTLRKQEPHPLLHAGFGLGALAQSIIHLVNICKQNKPSAPACIEPA